MSDNNEMTPEEAQTKLNYRKINNLINNIAIQLVVFAVIIYATFENNIVAIIILYAYTAFIMLALYGFINASIKPVLHLSQIVTPSHPMLVNTPLGKVIRGMGMAFSLVEIPILLTHGFYLIAAIWLLTEIFQMLAAYKMEMALKIVKSDAEAMTLRQFADNPEWAGALVEELEKLQTEIDSIDKLLTECPEESKFSDTYEELATQRLKLITVMETRITEAARETMDNE